MHAACDLLDTFQGWEGVAEESNALSFRSWTTLLFLQTYVFQCMPFSRLKESQRSSTCVWSARNTVCAKKNVNWTAAVVIARHELWPLAGSMLCGYGLKWGIPKIGWSIDRLTPGVPWTQNFHTYTFNHIYTKDNWTRIQRRTSWLYRCSNISGKPMNQTPNPVDSSTFFPWKLRFWAIPNFFRLMVQRLMLNWQLC